MGPISEAVAVSGLPGDLPPGMTPAQREAVLSDDPVICVLAGAGTGKTGVLTLRVARRVGDGTAVGERVLVCTFSRRAADELRSRLLRLDVVGVTAGTIHRVALRVLRDWREHVGGPLPTVVGDRRRLLERVLATDKRGPVSASQLDTEIGWAKARMVGPSEYERAAREADRVVRVPLGAIAGSFAAYEEARVRRGLMDLDDLLLESAAAIEADGAFAEAVRWRHRHLFVDEMQDVNPAQFRLLRALVAESPDLFVVGDPNQSVYGWNGADPDLLADLPVAFPGTRVIRLDDNHRCSPAIVRVASAALGGATTPARATRTEGPVPVVTGCETDDDEARGVARQAWLSHRPGRRWSQIAVLARTNAQLTPVAAALAAQCIPFSTVGADRGPASDLGTPGDDGVISGDRDDQTATSGESTEGVVLSTFHRAKGLQWPCVFVVGLSDGLVPITAARSQAALDEERRLLYVALTRAEDELWCSWARHGDDGHRARARRPSRWLAPVEKMRAELADEASPAAPETIASHVARLRSLVSEDGAPARVRRRTVRSGRPAPR